jgi:hypothetical protein
MEDVAISVSRPRIFRRRATGVLGNWRLRDGVCDPTARRQIIEIVKRS